jgi:hypothetical protein
MQLLEAPCPLAAAASDLPNEDSLYRLFCSLNPGILGTEALRLYLTKAHHDIVILHEIDRGRIIIGFTLSTQPLHAMLKQATLIATEAAPRDKDIAVSTPAAAAAAAAAAALPDKELPPPDFASTWHLELVKDPLIKALALQLRREEQQVDLLRLEVRHLEAEYSKFLKDTSQLNRNVAQDLLKSQKERINLAEREYQRQLALTNSQHQSQLLVLKSQHEIQITQLQSGHETQVAQLQQQVVQAEDVIQRLTTSMEASERSRLDQERNANAAAAGMQQTIRELRGQLAEFALWKQTAMQSAINIAAERNDN